MKKISDGSPYGGAYILVIKVTRDFKARIGALGRFRIERGTYLYVGSAKRSIRARVGRHLRLAAERKGRAHWHIDYMLLNSNTLLARVLACRNMDECELVMKLYRLKGTSVPIAGFGSSDCKRRCPAHLLRIDDEKEIKKLESDCIVQESIGIA